MRLVIDSRGSSAAAGLNRYNGRGIYSSIGRKVLLSGLRNVTNTVEKANRSQLIADAVVNGHRHEAVKKQVVVSENHQYHRNTSRQQKQESIQNLL